MIGAVVAFWACVRWFTKRLTLYQTEWTIDFSDLEFLEDLNIKDTNNNRENISLRHKLRSRKGILVDSFSDTTLAESKVNYDFFKLKRFKKVLIDNCASNTNNNHTYIYPEDDLICDSCLNSSLSEVKLGSSVDSSLENRSDTDGKHMENEATQDRDQAYTSTEDKEMIERGEETIVSDDKYVEESAMKDEPLTTIQIYEEIPVEDAANNRRANEPKAVHIGSFDGQLFEEKNVENEVSDGMPIEVECTQSISQRYTEEGRISQDMAMQDTVLENILSANYVEDKNVEMVNNNVDDINIGKEAIRINTTNHRTEDVLAFEDIFVKENQIKNVLKSAMDVTAVKHKNRESRNTNDKTIEGRIETRWSKDARCEGRSAFDKFTTTVGRLRGNHVVSVRRVNKMRVKADFELWMEMAEMKAMKHPNVATFIGAGPSKPKVFVVWEYCERGSLTDLIRNVKYRIGPLLQFSLGMDVSRGLAYIHKSKISTHGHLTSNNVVVNKQWVAKITNFGLKKFKKGEKKRRSVDVLANATQMSDLYWTPPESIRLFLRGKEPLQNKKKTDIYALGMIFKQIICRNEPYSEIDETHSPAEIIKKVGSVPSKEFRPPILKEFPESQAAMAAFSSLTRTCWSDEPVLRPHARDVLEALKRLCPFKEADIHAKTFTVMERYLLYFQELVNQRRLQSDKPEEATSSDIKNDEWDVKTKLKEKGISTKGCHVDDYPHLRTTDKQGYSNKTDVDLREKTRDQNCQITETVSQEEIGIKSIDNFDLPSSSSSFSILDKCELSSLNDSKSIDNIKSESSSFSLNECDDTEKFVDIEQDALNHSFTISPTIRGVPQHGLPVMKVIPTASVLVCSLVDFQRLACHHPPEKMLAILDDVMHQLDDITSRHELFAVDTSVGGYMAVGGCVTRLHRHDHAVVTAQAALSCLSIDRAAGINVQVRVGVGSGPVVIATVGQMAPRMCVMGGAVVTAIRMEVTGLPLKIQACPNTHYFLKGNPAFTLKTRRLDFDYVDSNSKSFWIVNNNS